MMLQAVTYKLVLVDPLIQTVLLRGPLYYFCHYTHLTSFLFLLACRLVIEFEIDYRKTLYRIRKSREYRRCCRWTLRASCWVHMLSNVLNYTHEFPACPLCYLNVLYFHCYTWSQSPLFYQIARKDQWAGLGSNFHRGIYLCWIPL